MKLSKQTSDAVQILAYCHRHNDRLVKVHDIASELKLTKQMALKLTNILSHANMIETVRGPRGGIKLTQTTKNATLGKIVRALEAQPTIKNSSEVSLPLNIYIDEAFAAFLEVLDRHLLSDIACGGETRLTKSPNDKLKSRSSEAVDTA